MLLNSHLLSEVELVCDHVAIIDRGALVAAGRRPSSPPARRRGRDGERDALFAEARRDDAPRIVASSSPPASRSTRCACCSTLEDAYLEAVGRRMTAIRVIAPATLRESLRRRVFVVVVTLTVVFLGLYGLGVGRTRS